MSGERLAFLFPGQGTLPNRLPSPSGLGDRLLDLARQRGLPLAEWIEEGRSDLLAQTGAAQPTILIDSLVKEERLRAEGFVPAAVAGHSLGEYAALVSAGVLSAEEGLSVAVERGRAMAGVAGGMTAIVKLPLESVERLCAQVGRDVVVANVNGPTQVVISGERRAVEEVGRLAQEAGGRAIPLRVSGPFHSPLMAEAQACLAPTIAALSFRDPGVPVVSGVSGNVETDSAELKRLLLTQITACVRWVDVVDRLVALGTTRAIEVGPGDVLVGLGRRIAPSIEFLTAEEALGERR